MERPVDMDFGWEVKLIEEMGRKRKIFELIPDEKNPMLNPVVLETLFNVCDLKDLRRFRLVSKLWYDISLQRWRDKMVVHLGSQHFWVFRPNYNVKYHRKGLHWEDLKSLYEMPSIEVKPYRKFLVGDWMIPMIPSWLPKSYSDESKGDILSFWSRCGPSMRELELYGPYNICEESLLHVLTEETPNLVELKLTSMRQLEFKVEDLEQVTTHPNIRSLCISAPHSLYQMFVVFPNLQDLRVEGEEDDDDDDDDPESSSDAMFIHLMNSWQKLILDEKENGRKLNFKCDSSFKNQQILQDFLEYPHFNIENLKLHKGLDETAISSSIFQRDSLRTLQVWTHPNFLQSLFPVSLPHVTKLAIKLRNDGGDHQLCDLIFLKNFPNLTSLHLKRMFVEPTRFEEAESYDFHLEKLSTLQLEIYADDTYAALVLCAKLMPNLKMLQCPLTNMSFRFVCENWKGLKVLVDDGNHRLDDEGITGIVEGSETRLPNITDLKYLREFRTTNYFLSDLSVRYGFLKLEHLTSLEVLLSEETTDDAFFDLFARFRTGIRRRGCSEIKKHRLNVELTHRAEKLARHYDICLGNYKDYSTFTYSANEFEAGSSQAQESGSESGSSKSPQSGSDAEADSPKSQQSGSESEADSSESHQSGSESEVPSAKSTQSASDSE